MFHLTEKIVEIITEKMAEYDSLMPIPVRTSVYEILATETLSERQIFIMPVRTTWTRTSRGQLRREYTVAIVIISRVDANIIDVCHLDDVLNRWSEEFLIGSDADADTGGKLPDYACMGVTTIDSDEVGFIRSSLINTPTTYIGGLKLTFWK